MFKLFYAPTPTSARVLMFLEELKLDYKKCPINIFKKENLKPEYASIVSTKKVPALFDNGELFSDSANILLHLSQKHNKLMPKSLSWYFWATSELNPKLMQHLRELLAGNSNVEMMDKLKEQIKVLLEVLDKQLANKDFLEENTYSITDINAYTLVKFYMVRNCIPNLFNDFANIKKWVAKIDSKDSVERVVEILTAFNADAEHQPEEITNFISSVT